MSRQANPFQRTTIMILFVVGFAAFVALLYGLGMGDPGTGSRNGEAHGASSSVVGYKALASLLEKTGVPVQYSRSQAGIDNAGLLILTPGPFTPSKEIDAVVEERAYIGPTLIILPKWQVATSDKLKRGWVMRGDLLGGEPGEHMLSGLAKVRISAGDQRPAGQTAASAVGSVVDIPERPVTMSGETIRTVVRGPASGSALVGYLDDGGVYAQLDRLDESRVTDPDAVHESLFPVVIVADADLFNNGGMASEQTARHALALVRAAATASDGSVTFDLTFNGLGSAQNLLTLAFVPPFLSATICLITAALAAAWMAFNRFGPPAMERRSIDFGKTALVSNSASFIARMRRGHLVTKPYAALIRAQAVVALGISAQADDPEIDQRLDELGEKDGNRFTALYEQLIRARKPEDIANGAASLHAWKKEFIG
ncbi:DUF4350 domain-containing protein [Parasphingorhabdus sp.]|uniref:DUF4350 domain-containing protein n=1 Tax=Parasphingorhabdus sp. TaxID=2709688 RepID=UPI003002884B